MGKFKFVVLFLSIILIIIALLYPILVYSDTPFIKKWRTIYIETAMTTFTHQWLATLFMPNYVIDEVMYQNKIQHEGQSNLETDWDNKTLASLDEEIIDIGDVNYNSNIIIKKRIINQKMI
jgi:exopolysaccharide biosynthesis protein